MNEENIISEQLIPGTSDLKLKGLKFIGLEVIAPPYLNITTGIFYKISISTGPEPYSGMRSLGPDWRNFFVFKTSIFHIHGNYFLPSFHGFCLRFTENFENERPFKKAFTNVRYFKIGGTPIFIYQKNR